MSAQLGALMQHVGGGGEVAHSNIYLLAFGKG